MTTTLSLIAFFWLNNQSAEPASHNSHIIRYCFDMIVLLLLLLCGYAFMQLLKSCYLFNVAQTWKKRPLAEEYVLQQKKYAAILQTEIMCRSLGLQIENSSIIEDKSILRVRWKWRSSLVLLQILCIYSSYLVLLVRGSFSNC